MRQVLALLLLVSPGMTAWGQPVADRSQTCVDVRVGTEQAFGCFNDVLARAAERAHAPPAPAGTLGATSPSFQVGNFNHAATAERMGNTFGHAAASQRPPPAVFRSPLSGGSR